MLSFPLFAASAPGFMLIGPLGWSELLIILVIVLIFFGPKRLPEVAEELEAENAKLKRMLAEQMMDVATLKEMLGKNF